MCIKSEFKEICLKLATNGRSDKGFLLTSKVCPQGVFCPCPGAMYMYKIIKNVYKIRFRRDHFKTCNVWAKRKGLSVVIKILSPMDCLPLPLAIYIYMVKHEKMYIKLQSIFLNKQMGKVLWDFYWHQHLSPRSYLPLQWAIYMYKSITVYTRTSCQVSVYSTTGPLVSLTLLRKFYIIYYLNCSVEVKIEVYYSFGLDNHDT